MLWVWKILGGGREWGGSGRVGGGKEWGGRVGEWGGGRLVGGGRSGVAEEGR